MNDLASLTLVTVWILLPALPCANTPALEEALQWKPWLYAGVHHCKTPPTHSLWGGNTLPRSGLEHTWTDPLSWAH